MAQKNASKSASQSARAPQTQQPITLELVALLTPTPVQADKLSAAFGLEPVDFDSVREATDRDRNLQPRGIQANIHLAILSHGSSPM